MVHPEEVNDENIIMLDTSEIWSFTSYKSLCPRFGIVHHQSLRTKSVRRHRQPYLFVTYLRLFSQQVQLLGASIDYFMKLDRLFQQPIRLFPTISTTRTSTSYVTTTRCCVTCFGPSRLCTYRALSLGWGCPHPVALNPRIFHSSV
jgi:hypothetical protein